MLSEIFVSWYSSGDPERVAQARDSRMFGKPQQVQSRLLAHSLHPL